MAVWGALAVAGGGAIGALARWLLLHGLQGSRFGALPAGLLIVNAVGCLIAGFLWVIIEERMALPPLWREALLLGVLGAFTTFSGFTLEVWRLLQTGSWGLALGHLLSHVALCIVATLCGIYLARTLW